MMISHVLTLTHTHTHIHTELNFATNANDAYDEERNPTTTFLFSSYSSTLPDGQLVPSPFIVPCFLKKAVLY